MLHLGVRLEAELSPTADEGPGLLDAAIEFRIASRGIADLGRVQLGQMKVPLSAEVLDAPEDLPFVERADGALRLAPFRDVGLLYSVRLPGRGDPITLHLGIYNGEGAGHLGGGRGSMDVVRLDGVVGDPSRARLGGRWGLALALDPDTALPDGRGRAVFTGGDLLVRYRALQVGGELVWRAAERGPDAGAVWAWAAWDLIPSVLETRARLQTLDDGDDLHRTLTLGASFYYLGRRFRLAYEAAVPLAPNAGRETVHTASFIAVL